MMNISIAQERGIVPFPAYTGERIYMREFRKSDGLPRAMSRWQPTVDAMLDGIDVDGPIYLMVDQGEVRAGTAHRRPGMHIDGYWHPAVQAHGMPSRPPGHTGYPDRGGRGWATHTGNPPEGRHRGDGPGRHMSGGWGGATYETREGLLLASDVMACRAMVGEYIGQPGEGGDCSHIDTRHMSEVMFRAGRVYAGNVTMLHESLPVPQACRRTVVRLNVPRWEPRA